MCISFVIRPCVFGIVTRVTARNPKRNYQYEDELVFVGTYGHIKF